MLEIENRKVNSTNHNFVVLNLRFTVRPSIKMVIVCFEPLEVTCIVTCFYVTMDILTIDSKKWITVKTVNPASKINQHY